MRVEEWLPEFLMRHMGRFPGFAWPGAGSPEFVELAKVWRYQFVTSGITAEVAEDASYGLAGVEHKEAQHLAAFMRLCREIAARKALEAGSGPAASLEAAKLASRDCPDCGGTGGAVRYVHQEILGKVRTFGGGAAPVGMAVSYPCSCPLGRLVAAGLRQPGQGRDPLTVDEYPSLRMRPVPWSDRPDNQYRHRPSAWDAEAGRPRPLGAIIDGPAGLREFVAGLAAEKQARRPAAATPGPGPATPDPVVDRERTRPAATPATTGTLIIPEDDWTQWP